MSHRLTPRCSRPVAAVGVAGASLVAAAALGSVFLTTALDAWNAIAAAGPASPADGILLVAGLGGTFLSLWLGLGMALSALSALPGALGHLCRRLAGRVAPAAVRKVVAFVLGTTLTAAMVPGTALAHTAGIGHEALRGTTVAATQQAGQTTRGLAVAAPDASFRLVSRHSAVSQAMGPTDDASDPEAAPPPSWSPGRPESRAHPAAGLRPALTTGNSSAAETVVVLRGDTLWSIAAQHLGPTAGAADINAEWRRWLAANRDVIGEDADLILPGQLLRPPPSAGTGS